MVEKEVDIKTIASELVKRTNEDSRRIRLLEQRMDRMDNSISSLEDSTLTQLSDLKFLIEKLNNEISRISDRLTGIENEMERLRKELGKAATKAEVKQIETFIDLVNPITSKFVTKDEMGREFEEMMEKAKKA